MKTLTIFSSLFMTAISLETLTANCVTIMLPWLLVMTAFVLADLAAGVRKSYKLGVKVSWSTALRETGGKWVTYLAIILAVCMLNVVATEGESFAKWACLAIMALEGGSVVSNLLRPYGVVVTPMGVLLWLLRKSPLGGDVDELVREEEVKKAKKEEDRKWNQRGKTHPVPPEGRGKKG
jgi:hypothetical protein